MSELNELMLQAERLEAAQACRNLMGRYSYLHTAFRNKEFMELWAKRDDVSQTMPFGKFVGYEGVYQSYVGFHGDRYNPEDYEQLRGLMMIHEMCTDVIEVAADGKSARGCFITPGVIHSRLTADKGPDGKVHRSPKYCHVLWERYGSDFVCEDGEWKYLHEHVCPDLVGDMDHTNWAADEYERITSPNPGEAMPPTLGCPPVADPGPMHMPYSVLSAPQDSVPWPKPYETLDNDNTYTPFLEQK